MFETTLGDYIKNAKSRSIKMTDYFYPGVLINNNVRSLVSDSSILTAYDAKLSEYKKQYTFKDDEYRKYRYNPWRVSQDVYGTTEYWFLVLHANELYSAAEFDLHTLWLYTTNVTEALQDIIAIEDRDMKQASSDTKKYVAKEEFYLNNQYK